MFDNNNLKKKDTHTHTHTHTQTYYYCPLFAMMLVKFQHVLEGEITDDVTVQHKEWVIVLAQNLSSQRQWTSCSK
jgi:hypothetical protein